MPSLAGMSSDTERTRFLLQVVQPGLVGLVDGSISTLAPLFATAIATHSPRTAFLVGLAAASGAGVSMALSEGLSDDGTLTGRGPAMRRALITGTATFVGGLLHALPFLLGSYHAALILAIVVVAVELMVIAAVRVRYLEVSFSRSIAQVALGGLVVASMGLIIGGHG